jgi:hypothetical protein
MIPRRQGAGGVVPDADEACWLIDPQQIRQHSDMSTASCTLTRRPRAT